jgi:ABC-type lipoprotein export system ATPase subunit
VSLLLRAENVSLQQGGRLLFERLALEVEEKQVWVISGPSGAGKTSLLRILGGEMAGSSGKVQSLSERAEFPQGLALNESLSARENARLGAYKKRGILAPWLLRHLKVDPLLNEWGITDPSQLTGSLSGGEKQRVALVRALLEDWRVLLADEPTAHLDDANARRMLSALREKAWQRNGSLVLVLHHRRLAEEFATHHLHLGEER